MYEALYKVLLFYFRLWTKGLCIIEAWKPIIIFALGEWISIVLVRYKYNVAGVSDILFVLLRRIVIHRFS